MDNAWSNNVKAVQDLIKKWNIITTDKTEEGKQQVTALNLIVIEFNNKNKGFLSIKKNKVLIQMDVVLELLLLGFPQ